jgi:hypothetical protein
VSKSEQRGTSLAIYDQSRVGTIKILKVEKDGDDGVYVTFSDGTSAGYVVEELLALRPSR